MHQWRWLIRIRTLTIRILAVILWRHASVIVFHFLLDYLTLIYANYTCRFTSGSQDLKLPAHLIIHDVVWLESHRTNRVRSHIRPIIIINRNLNIAIHFNPVHTELKPLPSRVLSVVLMLAAVELLSLLPHHEKRVTLAE